MVNKIMLVLSIIFLFYSMIRFGIGIVTDNLRDITVYGLLWLIIRDNVKEMLKKEGVIK